MPIHVNTVLSHKAIFLMESVLPTYLGLVDNITEVEIAGGKGYQERQKEIFHV